MAATARLAFLYDGDCRICAAEAARLQRWSASRGTLCFVDISAPGFDPGRYGKTLPELMGRVHAFRAGGEPLIGMAAIRAAYGEVGLGWLLRPTGWPGLRPLFDRLYQWFARNRYRIRGRAANCRDNACTTRANASALPARTRPVPEEADLSSIVEFYTATDTDYGAWSRDFNMHFGYAEWGMNPFDREAMLERMNRKVIERLALPAHSARVADLGCGSGAVARAVVRDHPASRVSAVTIVPAQIARGVRLNDRCRANGKVAFVLRDFQHTGLPARSYDAVYAVESACHAEGAAKRELVAEAYRLLRCGGRLVIADCFRTSPEPLGRFMNAAYRRWCSSWAVPELPHKAEVREAMIAAGFSDIEFTDISWNVAPSIAHVPWVAGRFVVSELVRARGKLSPWRRKHVVASLLSIVLGLYRAGFGYYLVTARKPFE